MPSRRSAKTRLFPSARRKNYSLKNLRRKHETSESDPDTSLAKRKKMGEDTSSEAGPSSSSSGWVQDDLSASLGQEPSTSGRIYTETSVKKEGVKEELILEDYGDTGDSTEYGITEGIEGVQRVKEDARIHQVGRSSAVGPFETIICGSSDIQIKQEIFEDESEDVIEATPTWSDSTDPLFPVTASLPQPALATQGRLPLNKALKPISKEQIMSSEKPVKVLPVTALEKCKICNEIFLTPSDLVEHCILKHSDTSTKYPAVKSLSKHSSRTPIVRATLPKDSLCATASSPDCSTKTSGYSATTVPSLSTANTQGQPSQNVIPPYTSGYSAATKPSLSIANMSGQPPENVIPPYTSGNSAASVPSLSIANMPGQLPENVIPPYTSGYSAASVPSLSTPNMQGQLSQNIIPPYTSGYSATNVPSLSTPNMQGQLSQNIIHPYTSGNSAATKPSLSIANMPGQPPENVIPPYTSTCDVFDGFLKACPMENQKLARDKILELVNLLSNENVHPT